MRIKFQADADLDGRIVRGLRRVSPEVDIRTAAKAGLATLEDYEVLRLAAEANRMLISQDRSTMPGHFQRFVSTSQSHGVILLRSRVLSQ
jgi:predicted nuclease of predicted toxin-antitoxin system